MAPVRIASPTRVLVGDPSTGMEDAGVVLEPSDWAWDLRDADETGAADRADVWEVRLRRVDVEAAEDWNWVDPYGTLLDEPAPGAALVGIRCVDTGAIGWRLIAHDEPLPPYRDAILQAMSMRTWHPLDEGRSLVTSSGFGDGAYPLAVRRDDTGAVVEIRSRYIAAAPAPLTAAEFTALLPGAFTDVDRSSGPVRLNIERHSWTAANGAGTQNAGAYEQLISVTVGDGPGAARLVRAYTEDEEAVCAVETVANVAYLWARVTDAAERDLLVISSGAADPLDRPEQVRGSLRTYQTQEVSLTVAG